MAGRPSSLGDPHSYRFFIDPDFDKSSSLLVLFFCQCFRTISWIYKFWIYRMCFHPLSSNHYLKSLMRVASAVSGSPFQILQLFIPSLGMLSAIFAPLYYRFWVALLTLNPWWPTFKLDLARHLHNLLVPCRWNLPPSANVLTLNSSLLTSFLFRSPVPPHFRPNLAIWLSHSPFLRALLCSSTTLVWLCSTAERAADPAPSDVRGFWPPPLMWSLDILTSPSKSSLQGSSLD